MGRLTRKDKEKGFYYIPNKCFRMASDRYYGEDDGFSDMLKRLAEFEDFIDEQGFEDLQDLERYIEQSIKASELLDKKIKENQTLKAKIQELELADLIERKEE